MSNEMFFENSIHDGFNHQPVHHCAVLAQVDAEMLDLYDAVVLGIVNLCLYIGETRRVVIEDAHVRQTRWDFTLRVRGLADLRRKESPLAAIV